MSTQEGSMVMESREPRVEGIKHEFEKYPYGSFKRLFAAFEELTGIDVIENEEGQKT